jgi:hypothetical protein
MGMVKFGAANNEDGLFVPLIYIELDGVEFTFGCNKAVATEQEAIILSKAFCHILTTVKRNHLTFDEAGHADAIVLAKKAETMN